MNQEAPYAYFIGGAPRTGKSTLALKLTERQRMQSVSTDDLRTQIRQTITQASEPDLYYLDSLNADEANMAGLMRNDTTAIIAGADRESAVVWRAVESFVRSSLQSGNSVVVEGVAVLPEFVATLDFPHSVVHLGNTSTEHAAIVLEYARTHPDTWLGSLQKDTVAAFAEFCRATSVHIQDQARLYHQTYIEMSAESFERSLEAALQVLQSA